MELKIVNPDSNDYCEAVGISPERQKHLSGRLDNMVRKAEDGPLRIVKMHDIFREIASYCNDEWELMYCITLHCGWHARRGRILAPGTLNYVKIRQGIQSLYDVLTDDVEPESYQISKMLLADIDSPELKDGARLGVQRLLDLGEGKLASDIINKLTGFAF